MRGSAWSGLRLALTAVAMVAALPAFADISSFNAAVKVRDYKVATREAATTWPTLDKSRADIRLIAREFGYAAYLAGDYAAARTYAQAAMGGAESPTPQVFEAISIILLRLAEFELTKSPPTRDALAQAMSSRANLPGFDNISQLGIETLVLHDIGSGKWTNAQASTQTGLTLLAAGGEAYKLPKRRMELYSAIADYMASENPAIYDRLNGLAEAIIATMDAAPSDTDAIQFVGLYWDVSAWQITISTHAYSNGKKIASIEALGKDPPLVERSPRVSKLIHVRKDAKQCQREPSSRYKPKYPGAALYKGMVGTVIVRMDLDDDGRVMNPEVLSAAPEKFFGDAVLKSFRGAKFKPGKIWDKSLCQMSTKNFVTRFVFQLGGN